MIETHPLPPFLLPNAQVLILGSFPPPQKRWNINFYYPNFNNDMWRILGLTFFQDKDYFIDIQNKKFKQDQIITFLKHTGIAISDTAEQVTRLKDNASDQFLQIEKMMDISTLLIQMPLCHAIITTGDKATETLLSFASQEIAKPKIGQSIPIQIGQRYLKLYRLPSSSRAYPLALDKKANFYQQAFRAIGLLSSSFSETMLH